MNTVGIILVAWFAIKNNTFLINLIFYYDYGTYMIIELFVHKYFVFFS